MGADLYAVGFEKHKAGLKPLWEKAIAERDATLQGSPAQANAQAEVERLWDLIYSDEVYFRDSYNSTSVLWRLGLSWWRDVETLANPRKSKSNPHSVNMPPRLCLKLAAQIESATLVPLTEAEYEKDFAPRPKGESLDAWNTYFVEKRAKLLRFLRTAANEGGVNASL